MGYQFKNPDSASSSGRKKPKVMKSKIEMQYHAIVAQEKARKKEERRRRLLEQSEMYNKRKPSIMNPSQ